MNGGHVMNKVVCEIIKKVSAEYNVPEELLEEFYEIRDKERNINLNIEKTVAARAEMRELAEKLNKLEEKFKPYNLKFIYTWCDREDITNIPVLYEPATETKVIDIPSNEEINECAREVALENNFPELTGTPKQVAWANSIRVEFWENCKKNGKEKGDYLVYNITDSKFWIENKQIAEKGYVREIDGRRNYFIRLAKEHYIKE